MTSRKKRKLVTNNIPGSVIKFYSLIECLKRAIFSCTKELPAERRKGFLSLFKKYGGYRLSKSSVDSESV